MTSPDLKYPQPDADSFLATIQSMTGLPNVAYESEYFAQFERDHVLAETWVCVANLAQLAKDGWVHPVDLLELPLLIIRDRDGSIRVFHNVCSHRGMKLVETPRPTNGIITCPYHGWCYKSRGELSATPHIKGEGSHNDDRFDRSLHGLKPVRSHIFAGMVFVNLSGTAPEFAEFISPIQNHWDEMDFDLYPHGGSHSFWEIELQCNWKFAQENHVDGYHLPFVHPGLHSYSPLGNHYPLVVEGVASGQGSHNQAHSGAIGDITLPMNNNMSRTWQNGRAEFLSVFPNIMIGVQADHFWTVHLIPVSASKTIERMDLHYFGDGATSQQYEHLRTNNRDRMLEIFEEDRAMVEGMQRGRKSPAFTGGALSPEMDVPAHHFNKIVASAVIAALDK
ncbi:MAG: Rieske 2Fe-2S domain-containing protein [Gammaproteobacteria bacterium]|nr:Rieske 2Fe-2S domain-containing protein [Gammaproteobacteria bacterium]